MATIRKTYSVLLSGTSGEYIDVIVDRSVNDVTWWVNFRISNNGYYHYDKGNQLKVWFNDRYFLETGNVCAINIDGPATKEIASGHLKYDGTDLYVWVEFDQTQRANQYGLIQEHFYMYNITYDGNGGTYKDEDTWLDVVRGPVTVGSSYTTYSNDDFFVREGYTFKGWKDQHGSDWTKWIGIPWTWTQSYNFDVTLYAQWEPNSYTVTYDANGGTEAPEAQEIKHDQTIALATQIPKREGYNFLGWALSDNEEETLYMPGDEWNIYSDKVLYAVWIKIHTIIFDGNGGTVYGNANIEMKATDQTQIANFPTGVMKYHKFVGWNDMPDGSGTYYESLTLIDDVILYAIYEAESNCYVKKDGKYQRGLAYVRQEGTYRKAVKIY